MRRKDRAACEEGSHDQNFFKISNYFSLFGYLRGGSVQDKDPGKKSKIFQNLHAICGLRILIVH